MEEEEGRSSSEERGTVQEMPSAVAQTGNQKEPVS
jgi:hypothetical protein